MAQKMMERFTSSQWFETHAHQKSFGGFVARCLGLERFDGFETALEKCTNSP
jgi:hypothetical protein